MLIYLLKTILIQAIGLSIYYAFLRNEKLFSYARVFIWSVIGASFIIPLIQLSLFEQTEIVTQINNLPQVVQLNEINISENSPQTINWKIILIAGIILVSFIQLIRLFFSYQKLLRLKRNAAFLAPNIYACNTIQLPFSFLRAIYIPQSFLDKKELPYILAHEQAHIDKKHSWDKIIITVLARMCWFNPLLILFHKELELIHEYQVDDRVIQQFSKEEYLQSLLQSSVYLQSSPIVLTHSFFSSPIKSRIIMLHKKSKNRNTKRAISFSIFFLSIFGTLVLQSQPKGKITSNNNQTLLTEPDTVLSQNVDDGSWDMVITNNEGDVTKQNMSGVSMIEMLSSKTKSDSTFSLGENGELQIKLNNQNLIFGPGARNITNAPDSAKYTAVEVQAEFSGGDKKLIQFLGENIKYPNELKAQKIKGVVYLEFVINIDGTIDNIKKVRVPAGMDAAAEEAVRVVKMMPKWRPAKNKGELVRQYFTLPVSFEIPESENENQPLRAGMKDTSFATGANGEINMIVTELMPTAQFPGGHQALLAYIGNEIKLTKQERKAIPEGRILLELEIDETGKVENVKSIKVPKGMEILEKKAIAVIKKMPRWQPAEKNGKKVRASYNLPISFTP